MEYICVTPHLFYALDVMMAINGKLFDTMVPSVL